MRFFSFNFFWVFLLLSWVTLGSSLPSQNQNLETETDKEKEILSVIEEYLNRATENAFLIQGRLTLSSGTAVTTTDQTAKTTVYFTPHNGDRISLYSGTKWEIINFAEKSVTVPSTTTLPFDIFAYNNAGTLALETLDWTNDTTRATALTKQDGVYVKTGVTTRRYLGTGRTTTTSGRCEDSIYKRFLWNYYNRLPRVLYFPNTGSSFSYSDTWRAYGNDTSIRAEVVIGWADSAVRLKGIGLGSCTVSGAFMVGIGEDSVTVPQTTTGYSANTTNTRMEATYNKFPTVGYHYYQLLQLGTASGGCVNVWDNGSFAMSGITGVIEN